MLARKIYAVSTFLALLLALGQVPARAAATLLPPGENCFQAVAGINGMVGLLGTITGGSGGTAGSYGGVALTGGSGTGATANITVAGGTVTAVTVLNPGSAYMVGDVLSAASGTIGGTAGFSVPVSSVAINSSLAGGKVYFYFPNTSSFKSTWFNADADPSHQNTNPVQLDANGCAIIYGTGSYRQVVQDSLGNTVWDQITTDTSANNNTFWAGNSGGTPNIITVSDPGFNATDGSIINFTAISTNTGPATLNPSLFGAIPILKDTTAGPVSLTGGEITQNNPISVIFRASDNAFHILNPPIQSATGSSAPLCGAVGFKVVNNATFPNTQLDVTIDNLVMVSPSGQSINRSNVSLTVNLQVNGVNGLDQGSIAISLIYNLWLIDNGASPAGLASLSAASPVMPTGYTYKCRLAAYPTNSSANLRGITTFGAETQLTSGSISATGITGTCFSVFTATVFPGVPPTAQFAFGHISVIGTTNAGVTNTATGSNSFVFSNSLGSGSIGLYYKMAMLSAATLFYCSNSNSNFIFVDGWVDKVNAN